jgi:hypothetical protein
MTMKTILLSLFSAAVLAASPAAFAQQHHNHGDSSAKGEAAKGTLVRAKDVDAVWLEKARKAYPLKACLTSDEPLGSMGEPSEFAYRVAGKPDRLVVFCCEGCSDDFIADPAVYLSKIDEASKAKQGGK